MSIVLARRLHEFDPLLQMMLREKRTLPFPAYRTVAGIKTKLAVEDRRVVFDGRRVLSASR